MANAPLYRDVAINPSVHRLRNTRVGFHRFKAKVRRFVAYRTPATTPGNVKPVEFSNKHTSHAAST